MGFYAQDSWKITRKFTLDYGLRYDYSTEAKRRQYGRMAIFDPTVPATRKTVDIPEAPPMGRPAVAAIIFSIAINLDLGRGWERPIS